MRKKIVAGNWKMNTLPAEGVELAKTVAARRHETDSSVELIVCPPFTGAECEPLAVDLTLAIRN